MCSRYAGDTVNSTVSVWAMALYTKDDGVVANCEGCIYAAPIAVVFKPDSVRTSWAANCCVKGRWFVPSVLSDDSVSLGNRGSISLSNRGSPTISSSNSTFPASRLNKIGRKYRPFVRRGFDGMFMIWKGRMSRGFCQPVGGVGLLRAFFKPCSKRRFRSLKQTWKSCHSSSLNLPTGSVGFQPFQHQYRASLFRFFRGRRAYLHLKNVNGRLSFTCSAIIRFKRTTSFTSCSNWGQRIKSQYQLAVPRGLYEGRQPRGLGVTTACR